MILCIKIYEYIFLQFLNLSKQCHGVKFFKLALVLAYWLLKSRTVPGHFKTSYTSIQ